MATAIEFIINPITLSVIVMIILCLCKMNVILALLFSALVGGLRGGLDLSTSMSTLISGMGGNGETALSYILLGAFAMAINHTGVAHWLAIKVTQATKGSKWALLLTIILISCASQNILPVHIAFIPLLIPPLLEVTNKIGLDRRAIASAITFGLTTPYMAIPVGFGLIYHNLLKDQMQLNGVSIELGAIAKAMLLPALGMIIGLIIALCFTYRKKRKYDTVNIDEISQTDHIEHNTATYIKTLIAAILAFGTQITTNSLALGALCGLAFMYISQAISWSELNEAMNGGVRMMGFIAIVMLVAAGYGGVMRETGGVAQLVDIVAATVGTNQISGVILMLVVGLLITLGIGTSFGTIPILAAIYCPLGVELGFSSIAIAAILGVAGALGDAGSPASDSTLGPTAGLNVDHQHDHIYDTCLPTFLHFNIPLIAMGVIAALIL